MIPGGDLLDEALELIASYAGVYYQFHNRYSNDIDQDVSVYYPGVPITGSLQPVPRNEYYIYGYNLQKDYFRFFCSKDVLDLQRDVSSDQMAFDNYIYQCQSITKWYNIDGWVEVLLVAVGVDTNDRIIFGFNSLVDESGNNNFSNGNFYPVEG